MGNLALQAVELQRESLRTPQNQRDSGHHIREGPLCRDEQEAGAGNVGLGQGDQVLGSNQDALLQPLCARVFTNWPSSRDPPCDWAWVLFVILSLFLTL